VLFFNPLYTTNPPPLFVYSTKVAVANPELSNNTRQENKQSVKRDVYGYRILCIDSVASPTSSVSQEVSLLPRPLRVGSEASRPTQQRATRPRQKKRQTRNQTLTWNNRVKLECFVN